MEEQEYIFYFRFCFYIFIIDILCTFNTGFLEKGNVITSRIRIGIYYFKNFLLIDLIAIIPLFKYYINARIENVLYEKIIHI
jgi:hypothetical protein